MDFEPHRTCSFSADANLNKNRNYCYGTWSLPLDPILSHLKYFEQREKNAWRYFENKMEYFVIDVISCPCVGI